MRLLVCSPSNYNAPGRTQLTDTEPAKEIPLGWYDCGDGLYNPQNRVVYTYAMKFLRNAGQQFSLISSAKPIKDTKHAGINTANGVCRLNQQHCCAYSVC